MTMMNTRTYNNSQLYRQESMKSFEKTTGEKEQLLLLVAKNDMDKKLEEYLKEGLDKNFRFAQGNLLMHTLAQYDAVNCLKLLVKKGADINALSTYGSTPLENARVFGAEKAESYLASLGARADIVTLQEMIEKNDIAADDKNRILKAVSYNDELCDLIENISAFAEELLLAEMKKTRINNFFRQAMKLLFADHLEKIEDLKKARLDMNFDEILNVLCRYDLVRQQADVFRHYYLQPRLLDNLEHIVVMMSDAPDARSLNEALSILNAARI